MNTFGLVFNSIANFLNLFVKSGFFVFFLVILANIIVFAVCFLCYKYKIRIKNKYVAHLLKDSVFLIFAQELMKTVKLNDFINCKDQIVKKKYFLSFKSLFSELFENSCFTKLFHSEAIKQGKIYFRFKA